MKKTTAHIPPSVAVQYKKTRRPQAIAEVTGDGYTVTKEMQKAQQRPGKDQFGLPPSVQSKKGK